MRLIPLAVLALSGLPAAPAPAATRSFAVGGFDRIDSRVPLDVHVRTGTVPGVRADGPQELLDRLVVEVRGGELVIETRREGWRSMWNRHGQGGVIEVGAGALRAATLSGPGNLSVDRVRGPAFDATLNGPGNLSIGAVETGRFGGVLNGPGDMVLAGRTGEASLMLHGPGNIRAAALTSRDATVQLSGPGDLVATVTGSARGSLSGPGDITIQGGARCDIARSGPGDVHCR